jgi:hypothetical protein
LKGISYQEKWSEIERVGGAGAGEDATLIVAIIVIEKMTEDEQIR